MASKSLRTDLPFFVFARFWPAFTDKFPYDDFDLTPDDEMVTAIRHAIAAQLVAQRTNLTADQRHKRHLARLLRPIERQVAIARRRQVAIMPPMDFDIRHLWISKLLSKHCEICKGKGCDVCLRSIAALFSRSGSSDCHEEPVIPTSRTQRSTCRAAAKVGWRQSNAGPPFCKQTSFLVSRTIWLAGATTKTAAVALVEYLTKYPAAPNDPLVGGLLNPKYQYVATADIGDVAAAVARARIGLIGTDGFEDLDKALLERTSCCGIKGIVASRHLDEASEGDYSPVFTNHEPIVKEPRKRWTINETSKVIAELIAEDKKYAELKAMHEAGTGDRREAEELFGRNALKERLDERHRPNGPSTGTISKSPAFERIKSELGLGHSPGGRIGFDKAIEQVADAKGDATSQAVERGETIRLINGAVGRGLLQKYADVIIAGLQQSSLTDDKARQILKEIVYE